MSDDPADRRRAPRRLYRSQAICQRGQDGLGDMLVAQLVNISKTGASLIVRGELDDDEVFYLAVVNPRRHTVAEVQSTVRWRREEGPGVFRLGVSFHENLTDSQVDAVV